jgi:hypothetical protein
MGLAVRAFRRLPPRLGALHAADILTARTRELRQVPRVPRAFEVRPAGEGDGPLLAQFFARSGQSPRTPSTEDACVMAVGDGAVQALEWVRWGPSEYVEDAPRLGVRFAFPARSCWLHHGRNLESDGLGPWGMVMGRLRPYLEERGVDRVFLQVSADNAYSAACHASLGFRRLGTVASLRLLRGRVVGLRRAGHGWSGVGEGPLDLGRLVEG